MDGTTLGTRIAEARKALDLTQEHLATSVGIDRTALGLIEKGKRKVSAVELVGLATALNTPLAWFVRDPLPMVVSRRSDAGPSHEITARLDRSSSCLRATWPRCWHPGQSRRLPTAPPGRSLSRMTTPKKSLKKCANTSAWA